MIPTKNLDKIEHFAKILMKHVGSEGVILLSGNLGASKITLTQFVGKYLGIKRSVSSPALNIIESYGSKELKFHHVDCCHLEGSDEDLRLNKYFEDDAVTIVEWGQFIQELLPEKYLATNITTMSESQRQVNVAAKGYHYAKIKEGIDNEPTVN